jgi:hypothetical protein
VTHDQDRDERDLHAADDGGADEGSGTANHGDPARSRGCLEEMS